MDSVTASDLRAVHRPEAVDALFRSLGFTEEDDLATLAAWALEGAAFRDNEAALARARHRVDAWFQRTLAVGLVRGRVAFLQCGLAGLGAGVLTGEVALSASTLEALKAAVPVGTPEEIRCVMPEQQLTLNPLAALFRRIWQTTPAP